MFAMLDLTGSESIKGKFVPSLEAKLDVIV